MNGGHIKCPGTRVPELAGFSGTHLPNNPRGSSRNRHRFHRPYLNVVVSLCRYTVNYCCLLSFLLFRPSAVYLVHFLPFLLVADVVFLVVREN